MSFVFNLSALTSTERIAKSELYVNNRYVRLKLAFNMYYVNSLADVSGGGRSSAKASSSMTIDLSNYRNIRYKKQNGWQMFSIQDSLSSYMNARSRIDQIESARGNRVNTNSSAFIYYTYDTTTKSSAAETASSSKDLLLVMEMAATFNRNSRRFKKFPPDSFNPYLMVYSTESDVEMKNFFLNRIPPAFTELAGFKAQTPAVVGDEKTSKEMDDAWASFNQAKDDQKHQYGNSEFTSLRKFEQEVDRMNEEHEEQPTNQKNRIELVSILTSTTKQPATTAKTTSTPGRDSKYYYNYLPKADADLISTGIIDSSADPEELKFFIDELKAQQKPALMDSVRAAKRKREINSTTTRVLQLAKPKLNRIDLKSTRQKKISPSFDDLYDEHEFDDTASQEIVPFKATIKNDHDESVGTTFDSSKWTEKEGESESKESCRTRPMMIDFVDLTFSAWILEPQSYQSNYCGGTCKSSLSQKLSSSNYATLQGILNILNYNTSSRVSELCCTPSRTESLPILYVDTNSADHVVKLLPDMVIKECACH